MHDEKEKTWSVTLQFIRGIIYVGYQYCLADRLTSIQEMSWMMQVLKRVFEFLFLVWLFYGVLLFFVFLGLVFFFLEGGIGVGLLFLFYFGFLQNVYDQNIKSSRELICAHRGDISNVCAGVISMKIFS